MWLPGRVEQRHKKRAYLIWAALVGALIAYTVWIVVSTVNKRDNPSISLTLENDTYPFPNLSVCLQWYAGCDHEEVQICRDSTIEQGLRNIVSPTEGFVANQSDVTGVNNVNYRDCMDYDVSSLTRSTTDDSGEFFRQPPRVLLLMGWVANNSEAETLSAISLHASVYMYDAEIELTEEAQKLNVAYTRIPYGTVTTLLQATVVNVGLVETIYLDGSSDKVYSALSVSHNDYLLEEDSGWTATYEDGSNALLVMELVLDSLSHTVLEEIDPLSLASIIGSVGGAWEILLIIWGFIFITRQQEPDQSGRDFLKAAKTVKTTVDSRRRPSVSISAGVEEVPSWDRGGSSVGGVALGGVLIRMFEDHGLVAVINASRVKKFLKSEYNAKSLKGGATEPALKQLLPANTYLVVVPPGSTAISIARIVVRYCRRGGDAVEGFGNIPIVVKVKRAKCSVVQSQALSASPYIEASANIGDESDVDIDEGTDAPNFPPAYGDNVVPREAPRHGQGTLNHLLDASGEQPRPTDIPRPAERPFARPPVALNRAPPQYSSRFFSRNR